MHERGHAGRGPALAPFGLIRMPSTHHVQGRPLWRRFLLLAFATVALAAPAPAQRTLGTVGRDLVGAGSDIWAGWTSPIDATGRDWLAAAAVAAGGVVVSPFDDDIDRWVVRNDDGGFQRALKPLRENRGTNLGDLPTGRMILPISGGLYLVGFVADRSALRDAALGCVASQQANSAVRHVTYALVARTRPSEFAVEGTPSPARQGDQYEIGVPGGEWEEHSFFGGHVANAFACATFFSERFELGYVEPVLYAFATGIGVARTVDRRHWVSDNLLGAAFGYAVGRAIAHRQKERLRERDPVGGGSADARRTTDPPMGRLLLDAGSSASRVGWEIRF